MIGDPNPLDATLSMPVLDILKTSTDLRLGGVTLLRVKIIFSLRARVGINLAMRVAGLNPPSIHAQ